jgi:hypothetical protein
MANDLSSNMTWYTTLCIYLLPIHPPIYLLNYLPTYYPLTHLPIIYLLTYLLYHLTYLPTYLHMFFTFIQPIYLPTLVGACAIRTLWSCNLHKFKQSSLFNTFWVWYCEHYLKISNTKPSWMCEWMRTHLLIWVCVCEWERTHFPSAFPSNQMSDKSSQ